MDPIAVLESFGEVVMHTHPEEGAYAVREHAMLGALFPLASFGIRETASTPIVPAEIIYHYHIIKTCTRYGALILPAYDAPLVIHKIVIPQEDVWSLHVLRQSLCDTSEIREYHIDRTVVLASDRAYLLYARNFIV